MKRKTALLFTMILTLAISVILALQGCGKKEADDPGYYKGAMESGHKGRAMGDDDPVAGKGRSAPSSPGAKAGSKQ